MVLLKTSVKCPNSTIRLIRAKLAITPGNIFVEIKACNDSRLLNAH